jgi:hypothetical protein
MDRVKRRDALPDLSHVLEESRPYPAALRAVAGRDQRLHTRFDKVFLVVIGSELYGDSAAIARNISAGGILVEMCYAPPLGTVVTVHFQQPRLDDGAPRAEAVAPRIDEIVVRAEVKHHHYLNFTGAGEAARARAIGLRFLEFVDLGEPLDLAYVH